MTDAILRDGRGNHFTRIDNPFIDDGYCARLTPAAVVAYVFLCRRADRFGSSFPGADDWEKVTGLHRNTVNSAIRQLCDEGLVSVEHRPGTSNVYTLHKISANDEEVPAQNMGGYPHNKSATPPPKNVHEVEPVKKTHLSISSTHVEERDTHTKRERRILSNGPDDAKLTAYRRADVFSAYADVFGIKDCSAEWFRRWNKATADLLPDVLETLTPQRMRALAEFVRTSRSNAGIRHTPDVALVLEAESEFERSRGVVEEPKPPVDFASAEVRRFGGAARGGMTGDELMEWAEKKERGEL